MTELATIANLEGVRSAVLGDLSGGFHDAVREPDGETLAAVMGFVSSALVRAGEELGLGALRRISVAGDGRGCVVAVQGPSVLTACVERGGSLAAVEQLFDTSVQGKV